MNYKKGMLALFLIMCILFCISSVAAGDVNETTIASDDTIANEETLTANDEISDDTLAVEENDDALNIDENNAKTGISEEITNHKQVLTSPNADKDTLTEGSDTIKVTCYKQTGKYVSDKKVYFKITDAKTGKGVETDFSVYVYDTGGKWLGSDTVYTNSNGMGVLNWKDNSFGVGTFKIEIFDTIFDYGAPAVNGYYSVYNVDPSSKLTAKVKVSKYKATIKANKMTVPKKSKKKFKINVKGQNGKALKKAKVKVIISTGGKPITTYLYTNSKGNAHFDKVSKLSKGKHKVKMCLDDEYSHETGIYSKTITSYITIKATAAKKAITIKAKKMKAKFKSGKKFKAKVIESKSKKPVKGIKVTLKVDKKKAVTLKTNKKGIVSYSTKKLKVGNHKVVLKVKATSKFKKASKKTSIKIVKKTKAKKKKTSKTTSTSTGGGVTHVYNRYEMLYESTHRNTYTPPTYTPPTYTPPTYTPTYSF